MVLATLIHYEVPFDVTSIESTDIHLSRLKEVGYSFVQPVEKSAGPSTCPRF